MRPLDEKRAKGIVIAARGFYSAVMDKPNPYTYNTTEYSLWATSRKYLNVTTAGIIDIFNRKGLIK